MCWQGVIKLNGAFIHYFFERYIITIGSNWISSFFRLLLFEDPLSLVSDKLEVQQTSGSLYECIHSSFEAI